QIRDVKVVKEISRALCQRWQVQSVDQRLHVRTIFEQARLFLHAVEGIAETRLRTGGLHQLVERSLRVESVAFQKALVHLLDVIGNAVWRVIEAQQNRKGDARRHSRLAIRLEGQRRP